MTATNRNPGSGTDFDDVQDQIHDLIQVNRDAADGFEKAAEAMGDSINKAMFVEYADERRTFATELVSAAAPYGVDDVNGSVPAGLHRAWMSVKDSLTSGDHAILAAAETGEDHAVATYESALEADLPQDLRKTVDRQFGQVKTVHDKVRALRDATK